MSNDPGPGSTEFQRPPPESSPLDASTLEPSPPSIPDPQGPLDPVPVVQPPPPEKRNRAGRNLPMAVGVSVGLVAAVLASLYVDKRAFVGLVCVTVGLGVWELRNAFASHGIRVPAVPVLAGSVAMLVSAYAGGPEPLVVALALTSLAVLVWRLPDGPEGYSRDVSAGITAAFYVAMLAGFAMLLVRADDGPDRIVLFILVTAASDTGGYAAGVFFGRHPMAPTISPKKSWEGFAGSVAACLVVGAVAMPLLVDGGWWQGALLGLAAVCSATLGDLGESLIKRDLEIKDMGSLLPGHGGVMDRLDSLLPTAPVTWLIVTAFVGG
jgi:phosphatidate cytidylyltransferase